MLLWWKVPSVCHKATLKYAYNNQPYGWFIKTRTIVHSHRGWFKNKCFLIIFQRRYYSNYSAILSIHPLWNSGTSVCSHYSIQCSVCIRSHLLQSDLNRTEPYRTEQKNEPVVEKLWYSLWNFRIRSRNALLYICARPLWALQFAVLYLSVNAWNAIRL